MNYQTWHKMQVIARDVLGDDVKKMLLGVHDDNGLTKWQRQHHGRRAPYVQIERYAATNRFAIDLKPVEVLALELLAHISKFARLVDYADEWTPEKLEKPVESVVQAMLAKLREKLDPDSEVTPEQLEKAKKLEANYRMGFLKPVTPEQLKTNWQETRRICTQLAPYLPEPDRAALLALLPAVEDDAPVVAVEPASDARPLQRGTAQETAILGQIKALGFNPAALPKNPPGKAGVKRDVREALSNDPLFTGATVFDKAWQRLRDNDEIVTQG